MSRSFADLILLVVAIIWGLSFVILKIAASYVEPFTLTGIRFLIGAACVIPFAMKKPSDSVQLNDSHWAGMLLTGVFLFAGALLTQIGMEKTTVANASFLMVLYVPMVPLIGLVLLKKQPHPIVWLATAGCVAGTYLLSGAQGLTISSGDIWVLAGTLFWAGHVILVTEMGIRTGHPFLLALVQFTVCGILGLLAGVAFENPTWTKLQDGALILIFTGIITVGVCFTLQVLAQRWTPASDAALILSGEAVFATIAAVIMLDEWVSLEQLIGCALILACILAVQLGPTERKKAAAVASEA